MIIDNPSLYSIKRLGKIALGALFCLFLIGLIAGVNAFYPVKPLPRDQSVALVTLNNEAFPSVYSLDGDALLIPSAKEELHLPDSVKDISVIAVASRSDAPTGIEKMLLYLKQSRQGVIVSPNEKVFLGFVDGELRFSDFATPISLSATLEDSGVRMDISMWLPVEEKDRVITDKLSYSVSVSPHKGERVIAREYDGIPQEVLQQISTMEWWGRDEFISLYGGESYINQIRKERLVLNQGEEILYVEKGDYLFWNGRKWQVIEREKLREGDFVARVRSASGNHLEIDVWGKEGLFKQPLSFQREIRQISGEQMEKIITRVRQRTSSRVSCKLAGKNAILKKGDWILNKGSSWRILRTLDEIESFLSFQTKGALFVADGVEKEEGKNVLKGHLFDETRSYVRKVALPIKQKESQKEDMHRRVERRSLPADDFDDDFDDDFNDFDDDFYDKNNDYLHLMNARRRHAISDDY